MLCKGLALKTELTAERLRELLHYDPETGLFTWLVHRQRNRAGTIAGSAHSMGYVEIGVSGSSYLAHRLAWLYVHGAWPVGDIDHINGNRSDNRISNLRDVTKVVNMQNRRAATTNNISGLMGVSKSSAKLPRWFSRIQDNSGKMRYLGTFETPDLAHAAYVNAKREMHEGCTI